MLPLPLIAQCKIKREIEIFKERDGHTHGSLYFKRSDWNKYKPLSVANKILCSHHCEFANKIQYSV